MNQENMVSNRSGRPVANQFIIRDEGYEYFQSYDSVIVKRGKGKVYLDPNYWDYSATTGKYRNEFLGESKKETQAKLDSGVYEFMDLN